MEDSKKFQELLDKLDVVNESGLVYTVISTAANIQKVKEFLGGVHVRRLDLCVMPEPFGQQFESKVLIIPTQEKSIRYIVGE